MSVQPMYENDENTYNDYSRSVMVKPYCDIPELNLPDPAQGEYVPLLLRPAYEANPGYTSAITERSLTAPGSMNLEQLQDYLADPRPVDRTLMNHVQDELSDEPVWIDPNSPILYSPHLQRTNPHARGTYPDSLPPRPLFQMTLAPDHPQYDEDMDGAYYGPINDARNMLKAEQVGLGHDLGYAAHRHTVVLGVVSGQALVHNDEIQGHDQGWPSERGAVTGHTDIRGMVGDHALVSNSRIDEGVEVTGHARVIGSNIDYIPMAGQTTTVIKDNAQVLFSELEGSYGAAHDEVIANTWQHFDIDGMYQIEPVKPYTGHDFNEARFSGQDRTLRMLQGLTVEQDGWVNPDHATTEQHPHLVDPLVAMRSNPAVQHHLYGLRDQLKEIQQQYDSLNGVLPKEAEVQQPVPMPEPRIRHETDMQLGIY